MGRAPQALAAAMLAALMALLLGLRPGERDRPVTFACVGDIMLGRDVARACERLGPDSPLAEVAPELRRADLAFGNLECPLTEATTRLPRVNSLRASPDMAQALANAGLDVLSLANNHAADYGRPGLSETLSVLEAAGIVPVGAGRTLAEAKAGRVVTVRGLRVGFAGFSNFPYVDFVHDPERPRIMSHSQCKVRRLSLSTFRRSSPPWCRGFHPGRP